MFDKILIANRGEPVVRIARAAKALGIQTVGVASEADANASWVQCLDEVVNIGGRAPGESYLQMETLVQAALQTGCAAVHPAWGFVAENPRFAALCAQHGLTFVGPTPGVMQRMALKWPAKSSMAAAGLTCIPGSMGLVSGPEQAADIAEKLEIPFAAVRGFYDPSVNFELEFDVKAEEPAVAAPPPASLPKKSEGKQEKQKAPAKQATSKKAASTDGQDKAPDARKSAEVVSLDAFRKK